MRFISFIILIFLYSCSSDNIVEYKSYLNHHDTVKYVGMNECKACHYEIYNSYIQTGMGKSFSSAIKTKSSLPESPEIIYDSIKDLSYMPLWINDSLWIREFRMLYNDTVHKIDKKVDYIIGSGHHTNSHLFKINGYLHQLPYTYYVQDSISDLPPGYEDGNNTRFAREINMECISCHNAYPQHVEGSNNKYDFIPQGIDCERCHGPGEIHVALKSQGILVDTSKYIDYSIVNPSKLDRDLQFDVCQRCHLQGTAILHQNSSFTDFKPGMHLNHFIDVYLPRYKDDNSFIMASHVERLKQSSCYINSEMTCVSCHNPHQSVKSLGKNYFDKKCMDCHDVCEEKENTSDCSSCHMPMSSSSDIPHVTITDHKISVPNNDSIYNDDSGQREFLGLFAINNDSPTNLSKAKGYLKRYESFESNPLYLDSAFVFLNNSNVNEVFTSFVQYYYLKKDYFSLINYYLTIEKERLNLYSSEELSLAYSRVADAFSNNGLVDEAITLFNQAIELSPFVLDYKLKLAVLFINSNKLLEAEKTLDDLLSLNPERKEIYLNYGYLNILRMKFDKAEKDLKRAVNLDPDYLLAYENLALLYIKKNNLFLARKNLELILKLNPNSIKAKQMLNNLN